MRWRRPRGRGETGSITVVAAGVLAVVVILTMGVADVGKTLIARSHARAAADAAALAAAQELAIPSGRDPAAIAADFASRNGAILDTCTCAAGTTDALVSVTVPVGDLLLLPGDREVRASARAVVDTSASVTPSAARGRSGPTLASANNPTIGWAPWRGRSGLGLPLRVRLPARPDPNT